MAAGDGTKAPSKSGNVEKRVSGTYLAYDKNGKEIWRKEGFEIGTDQVPSGMSICMKAMKIVDPKTGQKIKGWNPWGVI